MNNLQRALPFVACAVSGASGTTAIDSSRLLPGLGCATQSSRLMIMLCSRIVSPAVICTSSSRAWAFWQTPLTMSTTLKPFLVMISGCMSFPLMFRTTTVPEGMISWISSSSSSLFQSMLFFSLFFSDLGSSLLPPLWAMLDRHGFAEALRASGIIFAKVRSNASVRRRFFGLQSWMLMLHVSSCSYNVATENGTATARAMKLGPGKLRNGASIEVFVYCVSRLRTGLM